MKKLLLILSVMLMSMSCVMRATITIESVLYENVIYSYIEEVDNMAKPYLKIYFMPDEVHVIDSCNKPVDKIKVVNVFDKDKDLSYYRDNDLIVNGERKYGKYVEEFIKLTIKEKTKKKPTSNSEVINSNFDVLNDRDKEIKRNFEALLQRIKDLEEEVEQLKKPSVNTEEMWN